MQVFSRRVSWWLVEGPDSKIVSFVAARSVTAMAVLGSLSAVDILARGLGIFGSGFFFGRYRPDPPSHPPTRTLDSRGNCGF